MSFSLCKHFMHFNYLFSKLTEIKILSYLLIQFTSSQTISDDFICESSFSDFTDVSEASEASENT